MSTLSDDGDIKGIKGGHKATTELAQGGVKLQKQSVCLRLVQQLEQPFSLSFHPKSPVQFKFKRES